MESAEVNMVLVAEDEVLIGVTLADILADAGFGCLVVGTAQEAIAELEADPGRFRALLTDIRMPGEGSGWDVARRARELQPFIPVIYMTGDSANEWQARGVPASVLLQKPFVAAQLVTALATLINDANISDIND